MHLYLENSKKMFREYLSKYFEKYDEINGDIKKMTGVYDFLYTKLYLQCIRTFIYEMHLYKKEGKMSGSTPEERFNEFEKKTGEEEFYKYFQKKYPVLAEKMSAIVLDEARYVREILENFYKDLEEIKEKIDSEIETIDNISFGEGDTHNGGKTVAMVKTNKGVIVYKPHSMDGDYAFEKLLDWINKKDKNNLISLKSIVKDGYGWQEFVEYEGNLSDKEAKEYYYKCGEFLCLFYFLGTTDIHFENVIVHRGNPYFIDLETLVSVPKYLNFSNILETDFIPGVHSNVVYDFDYSGLCGRGNVSSKIKTISIIKPRTDEMRIENVESTIRQNRNIVWVNDEIAHIEDYEEVLLQGFNRMWRLLVNEKDDFIKIIDCCFGKNVLAYRQVLRATQVYSKFLSAATHPDYLMSVEKQQLLFERLKANVVEHKVCQRIEDEIAQLNRGDVPYYKVKYNSRDLYSAAGIVSKNYFNNTIKEGIYRRLKNNNEQNRIAQLDIIKKSLYSAYSKQFESKYDANVINDNNYVRNVVSEIEKKIIDDPTGTIYFINTLIGEKFYLSNINLDLYEGGGIIWLLACYSKINDNQELLEKTQRLFQTTEIYYRTQRQQLSNTKRIAAFSGDGSIVYLAYNLYKLTGSEQYHEYYMKYLNEIKLNSIEYKSLEKDTTHYDYMCGLSGIIVALCNIYKDNADKQLEELIIELEKYLIEYLSKNHIKECGIAHGISGMVYALIVLEDTMIGRDYGTVYDSLLKQEYELYKDNNNYTLEWCHGITGMLFVRAYALKKYKSKLIKDQITKLIEYASSIEVETKNSCLCHGIRGIKESISDVEAIIGVELCDLMNVKKMKEYDFWGLNNRDLENFMMGTSGVAYSYLRKTCKELPSVMTLQLYGKEKYDR